MSETRAKYEDRLGRVTAYIYDNLDDDIDLDKLADVACLSPYHWHRIYRAVYSETIAATVKRLRLHRAAGHLANTAMTIEEVAKRSGYKSLHSFTRVFGSVYGMPPAQYRREGGHARFRQAAPNEATPMYDITIQDLPAMLAVTIEHTGAYMDIGRAFDALFIRLGAIGGAAAATRMVGIYYDDPGAVPEDKLRARAGVVVQAPVAVDLPLALTTVPGGPHAILRHKGPYADMDAAYRWLYGDWLMRSGREAGDAPIFEEYLNNPRDTPPTELLTDIFLPLRPEERSEAKP